ncbi:signal peptide peptidase SppA [Sulfurimonas sp. SAG-AH-194-C21]|nr:signal peptide peptidase SppA [Sulfurimonas sp. SAG-AH-194-C21]MDF1883816.1 signal peptide peptidase SppA [Sulfurimonas sp. SAG-AH-194-C21]
MNFIKKLFLPITLPMKFIQDHFKAMLFLLLLFLLFAPENEQSLKTNNLLEINLVGLIMDSSEIVAKIDEAADNENIKGVLISVNSPGGAVAPSIEIAYAIKRLQEKKPVVTYAKGTIASGSYYASIWADEIIANPGSMVGSIGVIMKGADLSEVMQKIGIKTQGVHAGKYKELGTTDRPWNDYEVNELNKVIQGTYDMFTADVANARDLNLSKRDFYANAHIFTAHQAMEVGLVDSLGVGYDAKKRVVELSGVENPVWNKEDKFDKFMKKISASTAVTLHTYFPSMTLR